MSVAAADVPDDRPAHGSEPETTRKQIRAHRARPRAPRVDGRLDDSAWSAAEFADDFLQKEPDEGVPPSERTTVALVYDDEALYIGARCYSDHPSHLRRHLDRRDRQGPAEQFIVTIDSYLDRRTGYGFGVNTAGVRFDRYNPEDNEGERDFTFDPVWEARTAIDSVSWTVEMRIPFSQLRFNDMPEQRWGINFNRWIPERNEDVYWIYVPRHETGWASRFGDLVGLQGIRPSRRLELMPYAAGTVSSKTGHNPVTDPIERKSRIGGDIKMGLGPNMTLDATVNPDFGQVEADPAVVNLSAFETFFSERRPFFLEGSQLLEGLGPSYHYSRRIGDRTDIKGAAKVTGRMRSGTSIGLLAALTGRDLDAGEPATGFGVGRLQQQFGPHQSTAGLTLTGVERRLGTDHDLQDRFRKRAYTGGADWNLRFARGTYELSGYAGFSHIAGSSAAILDAQMSSARYFQRPDADYVRLDSTRTTLTGYTAALGFEKGAGRHWLWELYAASTSPEFELNDAGRLSWADELELYSELIYRETEPGALFRSYSLEFSTYGNWNYGLARQYAELRFYSQATWRNFWNTSLWYEYGPAGQDDSRTRGGPTMRRERSHRFGGGFHGNHASPTQFGAWCTIGTDDLEGRLYETGANLSGRVGNRIQLSVEPYYQHHDRARQYVATISAQDGEPSLYGQHYVFAYLARRTLSARLRMNYFFTPDLSLEIYAEPFAARGRYSLFGELAAAGDNRLRLYVDSTNTPTTSTDSDFHVVSFRSNMVVRWEFRPGSTLFLVWQRNLEDDRPLDQSVGGRSLLDSFGAPGVDFFAFKISYWIPVS